MKKDLFFLLVGICAGLGALAQHKVEYNFKSKDAPKVRSVRMGTLSVFQINDINKFLYDVKIESSQSEFNSEAPAIFAALAQIEQKQESGVLREAEQMIDQIAATDEKKDDLLELGHVYAMLFKNEQKLNAFQHEFFEGYSASDSSSAVLLEAIDGLKGEIESQRERINQLNKAIEGGYLKKLAELHSKVAVISEAFEQLESVKLVKNKLIRISLTDGLRFEEVSDKLKVLISDYPFLTRSEMLVSSFQKSFSDFKSAVQVYSLDPVVKSHFGADETRILNSIRRLVTEADDLKKKADQGNYMQVFEEVNQLVSELSNRSNFFVTSDPVQPARDVIVYSITIIPRKGIKSLATLEERRFNVEVPVVGGIKIDFSTGLCLTRGLHDRQYGSELVQGDSLSRIVEYENYNSVQMAIGALMHVSKRSNGKTKGGFTFGFGLGSTEISNAQVFCGGSLIFGSQERFIVSAGVSFANVKYLKSKYSLGKTIATSLIEEELTEKVTRTGGFLSFTYNLTNKKKE